VKSILIPFITSPCVISEKVWKVNFYLYETAMLHDTLDIYFLQNVHHGSSTKGEILLSIISRHFGLGRYKLNFLLLSFQPFGATLCFGLGLE